MYGGYPRGGDVESRGYEGGRLPQSPTGGSGEEIGEEVGTRQHTMDKMSNAGRCHLHRLAGYRRSRSHAQSWAVPSRECNGGRYQI